MVEERETEVWVEERRKDEREVEWVGWSERVVERRERSRVRRRRVLCITVDLARGHADLILVEFDFQLK